VRVVPDWGQVKDRHAGTQESGVAGVAGVQEEGSKSALDSKEWYSLAKAIGRWFAGEGDVGEASRFALFRMEQTGTVRLRLRPLQAEIYGHFVARASNWGRIKDRHAGIDTDTNSFCPPRTQHASGQSLDRRQQ
jgi:hypothetical protein